MSISAAIFPCPHDDTPPAKGWGGFPVSDRIRDQGLAPSAGGYRFADFVRFGLPLNILYFVGAVLIIPRVWSFHP